MAKLIIGCGYLGLRVARLWVAAGERVFAVTRSAERGSQLAAAGIEPLVADITADAQLQLPQDVRTVLFAVGHDRGSRQSIHQVYVGGLRTATDHLPEAVRKVIYISTTGVYGQVTEGDVDEGSPCLPTREGGKASLAAEQLLQASRFGSRAIILRLAGIYGPGRMPRSGDLLAGRPIDAPSQGWLNLIHVEDAARIVLLAEERADAPRTYVVSDGQPVQRRDYYAELARQLKAPPPQFVAPPPDSPAQKRAASDKRVQPWRMFRELKPHLVYPNYREGLAAMVAESA
ncbi:MAG TPA: NAD-dependent epimerase/dehydratase family protein [Pirellulaceae bacterium]|nr:NAD-dependent epimerase/dehydratase family protein [Pirellulaceae bacterium]